MKNKKNKNCAFLSIQLNYDQFCRYLSLIAATNAMCNSECNPLSLHYININFHRESLLMLFSDFNISAQLNCVNDCKQLFSSSDFYSSLFFISLWPIYWMHHICDFLMWSVHSSTHSSPPHIHFIVWWFGKIENWIIIMRRYYSCGGRRWCKLMVWERWKFCCFGSSQTIRKCEWVN